MRRRRPRLAVEDSVSSQHALYLEVESFVKGAAGMSDQEPAGCCVPPLGAVAPPEATPSVAAMGGRHSTPIAPAEPGAVVHDDVEIAGRVFVMGDASGVGIAADGERPAHPVRVNDYRIDTAVVTNGQFRQFIDATGYVTTAEQLGTSAVFHLQTRRRARIIRVASPELWWWDIVEEANWRQPFGLGSAGLSELDDHPVVQVSHIDALAYCQWAGRALPSEAQWEAAARGSRIGEPYPWGGVPPTDADEPRKLNIYRGAFPDTLPQYSFGLEPARSFEPNDFGLYNTVGNVWEWCADTFATETYRDRAEFGQLVTDPLVDDPAAKDRILRGGSYLCNAGYCARYRTSARGHATPLTTSTHIGFRTTAAA